MEVYSFIFSIFFSQNNKKSEVMLMSTLFWICQIKNRKKQYSNQQIKNILAFCSYRFQKQVQNSQQMENINIQRLKIPRKQFVTDPLYQMNYTADIISINKSLNQNNSPKTQLLFSTNRSFKNFASQKENKIRQSRPLSAFQNNLHKLGLKKMVHEQKVNSLVQNFIYKIKRNISVSTPIQFNPYSMGFGVNFFNKSGFNIPNWFGLTFAFLSTLQIFALFFVYTLSLIFNSLIDNEFIQTFQTFSMCFYTIEIIINFLSITTVDGRKILTLRQIFINYLQRKFLIDIVCLVILIVDINSNFIVTRYLRLFVIFKIKECLEKIQKIENFFINNFYKEQYWSLAKVIIVNFGFAHILAIFLLAMANFSPHQNWITIKINVNGLEVPWYELYAWAYYWGTTIMLTVGFGDLSATNYKQAICLTLLETFSCILLGYNINCVGNLISNIRTQDQQKTRNFKIMRKLAQKNQISDNLQWKVCNFIDESDKMKKEFGFQQEKQFISKLPKQFKGQFLKQSNIKIFQKINFFKNFTEKTLLAFAEKVQVKIAHPEQIIFKTEDPPQLLILKQGKVGYCTKLSGSNYCGTVIDIIKIKNGQPKLLYLGFLTENIRNVKFKIKSLKYSMIYFLDMEEVTTYLKNSKLDFENYCQMKDKSKHFFDEFQILECEFCQKKHSKMNCPKLHFCPIYHIVACRYLQNVKISKNSREYYERLSSRVLRKPFQLQHYFKKIGQEIYKNKKIMSKNKKQRKSDKNCYSLKKPTSSKKNKIKTGINLINNSFRKIEEKLFENIVKIFEQKKNDEFQQFFWDLECDLSHNFKYYFPQNNPSQLCHLIIGNIDHESKSQFTSIFTSFITHEQ